MLRIRGSSMALMLEPEEQALLLATLGDLVKAAGAAPLLAGPVEPTPAFFPDRFEPTAEGARVLADRLLGYAGLERLRAVVEVGSSERERAEDGAPIHAAAWFTGVEGFRCFFGVAGDHLRDADGLAASMAHEVAHAWRQTHGLVGHGPLPEEPATDATTVYLGFGILNTQAAERLHTSGRFEGTTSITSSWQQRLGYLPVDAMAFLLAAQAVARRSRRADRGRVRNLLGPNQAALFAAAHASLSRREADVLRALGLPPDRRVTPAPRPTRRVEPLPASRATGTGQGPVSTARAEAAPLRTDNRDRRVFRVLGRRRPGAALVGALFALAPFAIWSLVARRPWPLLAGLALAAWVAARWGARRPDRCSDSACEAEQPPGVSTCPGCGGRISGSLIDANQRLEAEDRLGPLRGPGDEDWSENVENAAARDRAG
jgi:hypothetical protein